MLVPWRVTICPWTNALEGLCSTPGVFFFSAEISKKIQNGRGIVGFVGYQFAFQQRSIWWWYSKSLVTIWSCSWSSYFLWFQKHPFRCVRFFHSVVKSVSCVWFSRRLINIDAKKFLSGISQFYCLEVEDLLARLHKFLLEFYSVTLHQEKQHLSLIPWNSPVKLTPKNCKKKVISCHLDKSEQI